MVLLSSIQNVPPAARCSTGFADDQLRIMEMRPAGLSGGALVIIITAPGGLFHDDRGPGLVLRSNKGHRYPRRLTGYVQLLSYYPCSDHLWRCDIRSCVSRGNMGIVDSPPRGFRGWPMASAQRAGRALP